MKPPRGGHQAKAAAAAGSPCTAALGIFTKCELISLIFGFITLISGILVATLLPPHAEKLLETQFRMSAPGGNGNAHLRDMWMVVPIPLHLDFYIFNWTNPEEFLVPGKKPHVTQLGPYRFKERFEKTHVIWNRNSTVTYKNKKTYWFDAEGSNGTLEDQVTALNAVAVSAAYAARNFNYVMRRGLSLTLSTTVDALHVTHTAGELLFYGYSDPLVELTANMPTLKGLEHPGWKKFAWFYQRNGSSEASGTMNMATGESSKHPMGELLEWNYEENKRKYWGDTQCAQVKGAAGEYFPPNLKKGEPISMFLPEMCRDVVFDFDKEVITANGVLGYRYVAGDRMLDNGTKYPENKCFCPGVCQPSGALNVSACRYGSPGFISLPHFHRADPYYRDLVDGLNPDEEKHGFNLVIEPTTGIPLDVTARFQVNIMTQHVDDISFADGLPNVYFPMIWLEQKVTAPPLYAIALRVLLRMGEWGYIGGIVAACFGAFLFIGSIIKSNVRRALEEKRGDPVPLSDIEIKKPSMVMSDAASVEEQIPLANGHSTDKDVQKY